MGNKKFEQALQSFQKALQILEKDVPYDDGRCGIVTGYIRAGDALLQMRRTAEAEEAYRKALAKSDLASAMTHNDAPALQSIAGAYAALGSLRLTMAAQSRNPADASRWHSEACGAWQQGSEIRKRLISPPRFSASDFPMPNLKVATESSRSCSTAMSSN
jgi:tetratricopeptide (TPR) repeat protein